MEKLNNFCESNKLAAWFSKNYIPCTQPEHIFDLSEKFSKENFAMGVLHICQNRTYASHMRKFVYIRSLQSKNILTLDEDLIQFLKGIVVLQIATIESMNSESEPFNWDDDELLTLISELFCPLPENYEVISLHGTMVYSLPKLYIYNARNLFQSIQACRSESEYRIIIDISKKFLQRATTFEIHPNLVDVRRAFDCLVDTYLAALYFVNNEITKFENTLAELERHLNMISTPNFMFEWREFIFLKDFSTIFGFVRMFIHLQSTRDAVAAPLKNIDEILTYIPLPIYFVAVWNISVSELLRGKKACGVLPNSANEPEFAYRFYDVTSGEN